MNKRIQELAAKAGWGPTSDPYNRQAFDVNMFAELIVWECIEVCNSRVGNSDYNTGRMHCAAELKEHFGVE